MSAYFKSDTLLHIAQIRKITNMIFCNMTETVTGSDISRQNLGITFLEKQVGI